MGRKPNALIIQHFERGAKLNDSSNRYEHTCRSCGEKFPKGRIDSLTSHLIKKCPALSVQDRQKVLLEMNNLPHLPQGAQGEGLMNGSTRDLPIGQPPQDNWSALGILAEVARRNDTHEKHDNRSANNSGVSGGGHNSEPQRHRLEIQEHYTQENPPVSYEQRVQHGRKLGKTNHYDHNQDRESSLAPASFAAHMPDARSVTPNLVMATNATNIAAAAARFVPSMVDPQLLGDDMNQHNNLPQVKCETLTEANSPYDDHMYHNIPGESVMQWPMLDGSGVNVGHYEADHIEQDMRHAESPRAAPTYTTLAPSVATQTTMVTQFSAETGHGHGKKPAKPVGRKKFDNFRRREVKLVRQMGACLRCRMLKKPCSPGSPCDTCRRVESARVWKQPCVRTRLAEELDVFSAGLHLVLAHQQISNAKSQVAFQYSQHHIEASHYPETTVYATFHAQEGHQVIAQENIDPGLSGDFNVNSLRILDMDNDDPPMKLEAYMKRMSNVFIEREPSHFMNITLNTAQKLAIENQDKLLDKTDGLLNKTLEFWAIVQILVDHEPRWVISDRINVDAQPGQGPIVNSTSYDLLVAQLNAAAEKKAAKMCTDVLMRLERLLLQKISSFEVFLIAIIILNCVEKSTWLFKSWEQVSFRSRWPLDKPPKWFADQGEKFTETLQMLLRMREVVPKTYQTPEGTIATNKDQVSRDYFETLRLDHRDVLDKQANHQFDPANSRCYELRFCSRILLPTPA
ncbi:uncharacterized protein L3040_001904 [Drepanopeziza brunnea f. sp. 'multigermtubi']|uniref:Uncharacterized protein n=1 Tax=Marssonina brunnea f. sp. multigermtubi (strain MB_m1) TaxID=1072389 RepID=K1WQ57_MARBU|nr:uncharacterized protein MBM_01702 [Drepanopeziza brunnea f. sp. 'multigermtubi' MB_m1]EKD19750.1 hypothetical protein MBM_01702 [Drepanopeziza brunnea f. sp. 'multigermtubi' MB_m1]KAJ5052145.1 hypothetical protein L3040_001904 [Drepanopeziza brunnea f. sp. 'multigermtubi']